MPIRSIRPEGEEQGSQRINAPLELIIPPSCLSSLHCHKNRGHRHCVGEEEGEEENDRMGGGRMF